MKRGLRGLILLLRDILHEFVDLFRSRKEKAMKMRDWMVLFGQINVVGKPKGSARLPANHNF